MHSRAARAGPRELEGGRNRFSVPVPAIRMRVRRYSSGLRQDQRGGKVNWDQKGTHVHLEDSRDAVDSHPHEVASFIIWKIPNCFVKPKELERLTGEQTLTVLVKHVDQGSQAAARYKHLELSRCKPISKATWRKVVKKTHRE